MKYHVTVEGRTYEVSVTADRVSVDGRDVEAEVAGLPGTDLRILRIGDRFRTLVARENGASTWSLALEGRTFDAEVLDERAVLIRAMGGADAGRARAASIKAPMPGLVVKVEVDVGQAVEKGQGVVIVEAMKMENELTAEAPGRVTEICAAPGDTVEKGQVLVKMEPIDHV